MDQGRRTEWERIDSELFRGSDPSGFRGAEGGGSALVRAGHA
jgi:hypothetical protein